MFPKRKSPRQSASVVTSLAPQHTSLWLVLAGLFLGAALLTGLGRYAYAVAATPSPAPPPTTPALVSYPRLPQSMEIELTNAFEPQPAWQALTISDPFVDRAGFGGTPMQATLAAAPVAAVRPFDGNLMSGVRPQLGTVPAPLTVGQVTDPAAQRQSEAESRAKGRERDPSAYSFRDVFPLGIVGARGQQNALIYATPTRQTFAVAVGTRLFDASLEAITDDGVVFRDSAGQKHQIGWTKVNKARATQPRSTPVLKPDQPPVPVNVSPNMSPSQRQMDGLQNAVRNRYQRTSRTLRPRPNSIPEILRPAQCFATCVLV